ncbi:RHS repeat-associated core domain-containing protein [Fluviicola sp.]|uniref:RHS repeat-associated core domain-containing protein n=1 Tax=Fluviicola sp. TaxID=1917219 RepID=UPI0031DD13E3
MKATFNAPTSSIYLASRKERFGIRYAQCLSRPVSVGNYSPFGVTLHKRDLSLTSGTGNVPYRYGFQGQETDDEIKETGNSLNFEYRMHDPRLGRFFAIDPLTSDYPYYSPYQFGGNQVILSKEIEGLEPSMDANKATPGKKYEATNKSENDPNVTRYYKWVAHKSSNGSAQWLQTSDAPRIVRNSMTKKTLSEGASKLGKAAALAQKKAKPEKVGTPWMKTALEEKDAKVEEVPLGSNSGPKVDVYLASANASSPNEWCASFVHWCLKQNGIEGAGAGGRNYLTWGIKLETPKYGAIAVFKSGHVGFYMGTNADGTLKILHGNWSNKVKISSGVYDPIYPEKIQEYRFPKL